eukprot:14218-Heterococcus_DN1.PRE.1
MISRAADSYILQASAFAYIVLLMSSAFTHACKRSGNTTHSIMHCTAACMLTSAHMTMKCTMVQLQAGALHSVVSVCHWLRTLSLVINFDSASLSSVAASKPTKGDACLFFYPAFTMVVHEGRAACVLLRTATLCKLLFIQASAQLCDALRDAAVSSAASTSAINQTVLQYKMIARNAHSCA